MLDPLLIIAAAREQRRSIRVLPLQSRGKGVVSFGELGEVQDAWHLAGPHHDPVVDEHYELHAVGQLLRMAQLAAPAANRDYEQILPWSRNPLPVGRVEDLSRGIPAACSSVHFWKRYSIGADHQEHEEGGGNGPPHPPRTRTC